MFQPNPLGVCGYAPGDQVACYECHGVLRLNLFDLHQKASALKALGKNWGGVEMWVLLHFFLGGVLEMNCGGYVVQICADGFYSNKKWSLKNIESSWTSNTWEHRSILTGKRHGKNLDVHSSPNASKCCEYIAVTPCGVSECILFLKPPPKSSDCNLTHSTSVTSISLTEIAQSKNLSKTKISSKIRRNPTTRSWVK